MPSILCINSGSSSVKLAFFQDGQRAFSGKIERIGLKDASLSIRDGGNGVLMERDGAIRDHGEAFSLFVEWFGRQTAFKPADAAGHRIVHGGLHYSQPCWLDEKALPALEALVPLAPEHLPNEIQGIQAIQKMLPCLPQAACFDTAFHRRMPAIAQLLPLPQRYPELIRYGFHGLSYESIARQLQQRGQVSQRTIIAHLGNGSSMAALLNGTCIDTTMGFTPAGGLVMGTRTGDLDPGVLFYLLREKEMDVDKLYHLINHESGMKGISGLTADMKQLLQKELENSSAKEAVDLFCRQGKKFIAALASVLGGIDQLVFTGGIGENAPEIRRRMCEGMGFIGIGLDADLNGNGSGVISNNGSPVEVLVLKTDEEAVIEQHVRSLIKGASIS